MVQMAGKELVDISEIRIDRSLSKTDRIKKYIQDIGNPYDFKVGDLEVEISFESDGQSLQDKMEQYFETMII